MKDPPLSAPMHTESVFKNPKSLDGTWVPTSTQKLLCRESQLKQLAVIHRPIIANHGEYSVNTLILGGPGIGKTLTVSNVCPEIS